MDEPRVAALLRSLPTDLVLWRGESLSGGDVDVLVGDDRIAELSAQLRDAGLVPAPQQWGRVLWRSLPGEAVVIDVLNESAWPRMYPAAPQLRGRARPGRYGPLVAAASDRERIFAAERVAGRPGRSGRVMGLGAVQLRAALRVRLFGEALPPRVGGAGRIIALSGMDGAGKSTAALTVRDELAAAGVPVLVHWTRLAADVGRLDLLARAVRRVLRRHASATVGCADLTPSGGVARRGWAVLVAATTTRTARRAGRLRRRGYVVVCDRWLLDALVDLRVRYGSSRAAEWLLRRGFPLADETRLLRVDPAVAAARKPGDQTAAVLAAQAVEYARLARNGVANGHTEQARVFGP